MNRNFYAKLSNGEKIPMVGFGGFLGGQQDMKPVIWALEAGYRHIDSASIHGNEESLGAAIKQSGIPRKDIFVTGKVWNNNQGYSAALRAMDTCLERLQTDYVDLYMIHWPGQDIKRRTDTWNALIDLNGRGKAHSIGVCNFKVTHIDQLIRDTGVVPAVIQVELHPFYAQKELREYAKANNIQIVSWGPVMHGHIDEAPVCIDEIASRHGKTKAQIVLRWHLQNGVATIPSSTRRERIIDNFDIFDFELLPAEMAIIDSLDKNLAYGPVDTGAFDRDF